MLVRRCLFLLACLLAVSAAGLLAQSNQGRKIALLVGVNRYDNTGLRNLDYAENDVNQLARTLKDQGFQEIILLTRSEARRTDRDFLEPTAENVRSYLKNLLARMAKEDTLLVAFSGHGVQFKADGAMYFCPAQTNLAKRESLVSLDEVYTALNEKVPGRKVLLVDACRNDPADGLGANALASVTRPQVPDPPGGTVALFSCSKGQRAFESRKHESGFLFHTIVEGLRGGAADPKTGEVGWLDLAKYVQRKLPAAVTAEKGPTALQVPEIRGTLRGELVLAKMDRNERDEVFEYVIEGHKKQGKRRVLTLDLGGGQKLELVHLAKGLFLMGASDNEKDADGDEKPRHEVELTQDFYLGKYEVTQGQYEQIMSTNPSEFHAGGKNAEKIRGLDTSRFPVENVSWEEAQEFCKKVTAKVGRKVVLPTEAEWEYACRAGTVTPFHWGNTLNGTEANCKGNSPHGTETRGAYLERPCQVGSYPANGWGLYDLHGNVAEWCADGYNEKTYTSERRVSPFVEAGNTRVLRGGSWSNGARLCRAANRIWAGLLVRTDNLGFRVALRLD